jgi:hypothetical protein
MKIKDISPSQFGALVAPSDSELLPDEGKKGWSVNTDGDVKMLLSGHRTDGAPDDSKAITIAAKAGVRYPDVPIKIFASGTTATGIHVFW